MKVSINGKSFEIKEEIHHEQDPRLQNAIDRRDWFAVRMLYKRPTLRTQQSIQRELEALYFSETGHKL